MQRIVYFIVILTTLLSTGVFAQHGNDFAGIPFGSSREEVIEEVMKMGYEPFGQRAAGDHIVIPVYNFGELPVQVDFIFNKNDKFQSFEIRTGRVERARLSKAFEAADYMSDQFTLKYGKPSPTPPLDETSELKESLPNIYQRWISIKDQSTQERSMDADISILQRDGRYFVRGYVVHRKIASEKRSSGSSKKPKSGSERPVF